MRLLTSGIWCHVVWYLFHICLLISYSWVKEITFFFTLRKQACGFSLMLAPIYQTVWHHILEACNLIPSRDSKTLWYKGELNVYLESAKKLRPQCILLQAQQVFRISWKHVLHMVGLVTVKKWQVCTRCICTELAGKKIFLVIWLISIYAVFCECHWCVLNCTLLLQRWDGMVARY